MNVLQKLRSLHADITESGDGLKIVDAWALAERLCGRLPVDQREAGRVFSEKDAPGLLAMIERLENPAKPPDDAGPEIDDKTLADALRAFRKRWKVTRLSDESRLGGRYTSGGKASNINAIKPPDEWGRDVWKALVRRGDLRDEGQGFYGLVATPEDAG